MFFVPACTRVGDKKGATFSSSPLAPSNFTTGAVSTSSITFSWTDNAINESAYEVERCSGSDCTSFAATSSSPLSANSKSYTESGLSYSTTYRFRVRAKNSSGTSAYLSSSNIATADPTLPATPSGLTTGTVTSTSIQISWTDNATDETAYDVEKCSGSGCTNFTTVSASPLSANSTSLTESGLSSYTVYRFRVRAKNGSVTGSYLTSSDITTLAATSSCASPTRRIIDYGQKGVVAGVGRGLYSDIKTIPGTDNPAIAYTDSSTTGGKLSLMISYWDGTKFVREAVAGDGYAATAGSATFIRLAFLTLGANAGRPMVFWTDGSTTVKMAMRSAALGTSGSWTAATLETIAASAMRALEVEVSPADHVGLIYITNSASGKARFIYCSAPCTSTSGFTAMSATTNGIDGATNATNNTVATGIAWCNAGGGSYIPAVTFGRTAVGIIYAACLGTLASCAQNDGSGWSKQTVVANATAVMSKLQIDASVSGLTETPKVLSYNAAGTALQAFEVTSASGCAAAPSGVTANANTFGGATNGNAWAKFLKDSTGFYHVISNLSTTNVQYFNSTTAILSTTSWYAAGNVDTLTLPAAAAGAGGAALTSTSVEQLYTSYGSNATPFNLFMGVINDYKLASNSSSQGYYVINPDITGNILLGTATGQFRNIAMASTSDNLPGIAYVDHSFGPIIAGSQGAKLKYAYRSGTGSGDTWMITTIPNTGQPDFPSIAFDHNNRPWISYYDGNNFRYYLVTNTSSDGTGEWTQYQFPLVGKTATATAPATDDTAVAMFVSGGVYNPVMVIINSTANGGQGVKASMFNYNTRQWGAVVTIDALGAQFGTRLSADFNTGGNVVVAYYDLLTATPRVKYNFCNNGVNWAATSAAVASTSAGREGLSIKINPSTSKPAISYYDKSNNIVYYNACSGTSFSTCLSPSNWAGNNTLTTVASALGVSGISANNEQIINTSLTFSNTGNAYVAYFSGIGTSTPSFYLADNSGGTFAATTMLTSPLANVTGAVAMNFDLVGLNVFGLRLANGNFISAYIGPGNYLYVSSCGD